MKDSKTDQWLSDGNCNKCRRQDYCTSKCSAFRKKVGNPIVSAVYDFLWNRKK